MSLRDGKCCYATRRVTSSREVSLCDEKKLRSSRLILYPFSSALPTLLDGFTVTSRRFHRHFSNALCPSVGYAATSRRTLVRHFSADLVRHFSTDFVRHFPRLHSAALLKCFSPSRRLCRLFPQALPANSPHCLPGRKFHL